MSRASCVALTAWIEACIRFSSPQARTADVIDKLIAVTIAITIGRSIID